MKLAEKAEKNALVKYFAKVLDNKPQNLALGVAEGTILFKLTFPITATVYLKNGKP